MPVTICRVDFVRSYQLQQCVCSTCLCAPQARAQRASGARVPSRGLHAAAAGPPLCVAFPPSAQKH